MNKRICKITILSLLIGIIISIPTLAAEWKQNATGWWWQNDDGSYPTAKWEHIGGKWYYFLSDGYMAENTWVENYYVGSDGAMLVNTITPDGYHVEADGAWIDIAKNLKMTEEERRMVGYQTVLKYPDGMIDHTSPLRFDGTDDFIQCYVSFGNISEFIDCGEYYEVTDCYISYPYIIPKGLEDQFVPGYEFNLTLYDQDGNADTLRNVIVPSEYGDSFMIAPSQTGYEEEDLCTASANVDGKNYLAWLIHGEPRTGTIYHGSLFFKKDCPVHDCWYKYTESFANYIGRIHTEGGSFIYGRKNSSWISFYGLVVFDPSSGIIEECQEFYTE